MGLESGGRFGSEGGVFSVGVVVGFDGGEDLYLGIGVSDERAVLEHFGFQVPMSRAERDSQPQAARRAGAAAPGNDSVQALC